MISQNYQKTTRIFTIFDSVTVTWIQRPVCERHGWATFCTGL